MALLNRLGALLGRIPFAALWSTLTASPHSILTDPVQVLARTAWGEARGQGTIGMRAVLATIGNRVAEPGWWGNSFISVCLRRNQYSCWHAADPNFPKLMAVTAADPQFAMALFLAQSLIDGKLGDVTAGADSYYALGSVQPSWAVPPRYRCTIGTQAFYRIGVNGLGMAVAWVPESGASADSCDVDEARFPGDWS